MRGQLPDTALPWCSMAWRHSCPCSELRVVPSAFLFLAPAISGAIRSGSAQLLPMQPGFCLLFHHALDARVLSVHSSLRSLMFLWGQRLSLSSFYAVLATLVYKGSSEALRRITRKAAGVYLDAMLPVVLAVPPAVL